MNLANDLFMLMFSLTKLSSKKQILDLYEDALQTLLQGCKVQFSSKTAKDAFEIKTSNSSFGFIKIYNLEKLSKDQIALVKNSVHMLAIFLERIELNNRLKKEIEVLDGLAKDRLEVVEKTVQELKNARTASLNLIEDLTEEISRRKIFEAKLRESEERYKTLFQSASDFIFLHEFSQDKSPGNFIEVNDLVLKRLGYTKSEIKKLGPTSIIAESDLEKVPDETKALQQNKNLIFNKNLVCKDGTYIPVEINAHIVERNNESIVISIGRDVSERIKAEKELKENEERLKLALHGGDLGLWDWNIKTNEVIMNDRWANMLGFKLEEIHLSYGIICKQYNLKFFLVKFNFPICSVLINI
ncbi:MAG: PAS domain S-box protein [Melioribacteraceae bacterium]|nr:PAS domain S-box protein [Melioribacteraceae bacterium]MCF8265829.1 PAS domain S-box protein [Melioribacteraceae bacterium]MCF8432625.1 PAS domain S-box protein [Melioribacteraceae bacterium]